MRIWMSVDREDVFLYMRIRLSLPPTDRMSRLSRGKGGNLTSDVILSWISDCEKWTERVILRFALLRAYQEVLRVCWCRISAAHTTTGQ